MGNEDLLAGIPFAVGVVVVDGVEEEWWWWWWWWFIGLEIKDGCCSCGELEDDGNENMILILIDLMVSQLLHRIIIIIMKKMMIKWPQRSKFTHSCYCFPFDCRLDCWWRWRAVVANHTSGGCYFLAYCLCLSSSWHWQWRQLSSSSWSWSWEEESMILLYCWWECRVVAILLLTIRYCTERQPPSAMAMVIEVDLWFEVWCLMFDVWLSWDWDELRLRRAWDCDRSSALEAFFLLS